jgi:hypothetical protein
MSSRTGTGSSPASARYSKTAKGRFSGLSGSAHSVPSAMTRAVSHWYWAAGHCASRCHPPTGRHGSVGPARSASRARPALAGASARIQRGGPRSAAETEGGADGSFVRTAGAAIGAAGGRERRTRESHLRGCCSTVSRLRPGRCRATCTHLLGPNLVRLVAARRAQPPRKPFAFP